MNQMTEMAVRTENLTKKYKEKTAVDSLNLSIYTGELFALLGINGAGKTTTIKMITGLTPPSNGDAYIFGKSIRNEIHSIKPLINISPQETAVAENLSVAENLMMTAGIYGSEKNVAVEKTEKIIREICSNRNSRNIMINYRSKNRSC